MITSIRNLVKRFRYGNIKNVHLPAKTSNLCKLRKNVFVNVRPSASDYWRIIEYQDNIYIDQNSLTELVKSMKPNVILDIGANIGLGSLALLDFFSDVSCVIGVEAEYQNYLMLSDNYGLYLDHYPATQFHSIYAVASNISAKNQLFSVQRLSGGVSASGTFTFSNANEIKSNQIYVNSGDPFDNEGIVFADQAVSVSDLLKVYDLENHKSAVIKIDIEGGEETLFLSDTEWLDKTLYLIIEIHDHMGAPKSSSNLIRSLSNHDFAVVPRDDVLHCYNRKLLGL